MADNNRIKLSWAQIVWGITMLVTATAGWWDLRSRHDALAVQFGLVSSRMGKIETALESGVMTRREADLLLKDAEKTHGTLERRLDRLEGRR